MSRRLADASSVYIAMLIYGIYRCCMLVVLVVLFSFAYSITARKDEQAPN